jgi:hypothetical protein
VSGWINSGAAVGSDRVMRKVMVSALSLFVLVHEDVVESVDSGWASNFVELAEQAGGLPFDFEEVRVIDRSFRWEVALCDEECSECSIDTGCKPGRIRLPPSKKGLIVTYNLRNEYETIRAWKLNKRGVFLVMLYEALNEIQQQLSLSNERNFPRLDLLEDICGEIRDHIRSKQNPNAKKIRRGVGAEKLVELRAERNRGLDESSKQLFGAKDHGFVTEMLNHGHEFERAQLMIRELCLFEACYHMVVCHERAMQLPEFADGGNSANISQQIFQIIVQTLAGIGKKSELITLEIANELSES